MCCGFAARVGKGAELPFYFSGSEIGGDITLNLLTYLTSLLN
jgi:hypothetical protein